MWALYDFPSRALLPRHHRYAVLCSETTPSRESSQFDTLCITKTPSSGFPSNVTLLLPGRLLNPASSSLPHVADFNGIRHRWDLRDPQFEPLTSVPVPAGFHLSAARSP